MPRAIDWAYYDALRPAVRAFVARGLTVAEIAEALNDSSITTVTGQRWNAAALQWAMLWRLGVSTVHYTPHLPTRKRRRQHAKRNRTSPARRAECRGEVYLGPTE